MRTTPRQTEVVRGGTLPRTPCSVPASGSADRASRPGPRRQSARALRGHFVAQSFCVVRPTGRAPIPSARTAHDRAKDRTRPRSKPSTRSARGRRGDDARGTSAWTPYEKSRSSRALVRRALDGACDIVATRCWIDGRAPRTTRPRRRTWRTRSSTAPTRSASGTPRSARTRSSRRGRVPICRLCGARAAYLPAVRRRIPTATHRLRTPPPRWPPPSTTCRRRLST